MARTITSPGVQIGEQDLSLRAVTNDATTIVLAGFAPQGPTYEPLSISSLSEYEQVFGLPTNGAERYFYHTVKAAFQSPGSLNITRLPYGAGLGSGYGSRHTALVYPVRGKRFDNDDIQTNLSALSSNGDVVVLGRPSLVELTDGEYDDIINGSAFTWTNIATRSTYSTPNQFGDAGIIILNKSKLTTNSRFEGYYIGIIDNTTVNPQVDFRGINQVLSVAVSGSKLGGSALTEQYLELNTNRCNFPLSATFDGQTGSVSEVMENVSSSTIGLSSLRDYINVGVFKLAQSNVSPDVYQLGYFYQPTDSFSGSLYYERIAADPTGGPSRSTFIENTDDSSKNVQIMVNPYISNRDGESLLDTDKTPKRVIRVLSQGLRYASIDSNFTRMTTNAVDNFINAIGDAGALFPLGTYVLENQSSKIIGNVPGKLQKVFEKMENYDVYPITLTVEGGLGTIFAGAEANNGIFDDTKYITAVNGLTASDVVINPSTITYRDNYLAVFNTFQIFAEDQRKDHLFIADPALPILVQGENLKTLDKEGTNFTSNIYWPLRNLFNSVNTSYATTYANCVKVNDVASSKNVWVPFSGFAAAAMANTDSNYQPWFAPAGFLRGVVGGVLDIALYAKQKQRDQLYKINLNPVAFFPAEGFVIYGQKTLQKLPSAFDRVNVRRLFINLETLVRNTVKFFLFEPNTLFTRTQVLNAITPFFENAKNTQGVYDYLLICDEKNNTPAIIDNNELVVDIYLKPTRSSEYILVNFYATRTSQDFNEIVS
jgi:uncharacterized protein (DUF3820 family)